MQICKKIISILFSSIMVVGTVITASATESHSYKAVTAESNPYQAVIDKLNNEYSLNIHFMTPVSFYDTSGKAGLFRFITKRH